jgi:predicted CXXCH cytochrome family protein
MCLGCHDGTTQTVAGITDGGPFDLDTDLTDDHPISFQYTASLPATEIGVGLYDPTLQPSGLPAAGTITVDMLDSNNKIQCTTCHDVHGLHTSAALRKDNSTGDLCKTCHMK